MKTVVVLGSNYYSHAEYVLTKVRGPGDLSAGRYSRIGELKIQQNGRLVKLKRRTTSHKCKSLG